MRAVLIYVLVNPAILKLAFDDSFNLSQFISIDAAFFKTAIDQQLPFCFALAFIMGANLIARDLAHGGIVLFATRPIHRWEYLFGKFMTLFLVFMLLTWMQSILLFVLQCGASGELSPWRLYFWRDYAWIAGAITVYCTLASATLAIAILAASSL